MHVLINGKDNSSWNSAMPLVRAVTRVNTKGQPIVYAYIALKKMLLSRKSVSTRSLPKQVTQAAVFLSLAVLTFASSVHQSQKYDAIIALGGGQTHDGGVPEHVLRRCVCPNRLLSTQPLSLVIIVYLDTNHALEDSSWHPSDIFLQVLRFLLWRCPQAPRTSPTRATCEAFL